MTAQTTSATWSYVDNQIVKIIPRVHIRSDQVAAISSLTSEPRHNRLRRLRPGDLVDDLAAAQQHRRRDTPHAEAGRKAGILPGIDLDHGGLSRQSLGNRSHRRCE